MQQEPTADGASPSKMEKLREQMSDADSDVALLTAQLALARHYADASDGVNGLAMAREARALALRLKDYPAAAHALCSASVSHYHRSDYVSAVATAMDAWDFARRAESPADIVESHVALGLSMLALGELDASSQVIEQGLALSLQYPELLDARVRLVGLKAMLRYQHGDMAETEKLCAETVGLSASSAPTQLALSHGNWGIALLRWAEKQAADGSASLEILARSREHLEIALRLAGEEGDEMRIADRMASLGMVAMLAGDLDNASDLLNESQRRSLSLDYVRTAVFSTLYLGKFHLRRREAPEAIAILRQTVSLATRGVAGRYPACRTVAAGRCTRYGGRGI